MQSHIRLEICKESFLRWEMVDQPHPQGFSLKKMGGALFLPHPFFKGNALGTRLMVDVAE